jgi:ubiquinone/menaquinone biosynthesis C-methylase UbiE
MSVNHQKGKPDYGFDGTPFTYLLIGIGACVLTVFLLSLSNPLLKILGVILLVFTIVFIGVIAKFIYYVKLGKLRLRDRLLSMVDWKGNETVLDIGTGRGLLMIGAAKRLTSGKSIGIDIWRPGDMHANSLQNTLENARLEGVLDTVEVKNVDVQKMPFPDGSFDVVLSNLCIHNISSKNGRDQACREIARVLKSGGKAIICDAKNLKDYAEVFSNEGMKVEILRGHFLENAMPWNKILEASK